MASLHKHPVLEVLSGSQIVAFLTLSKDLRAGVSWRSGFTLSFAGRRFFCSAIPQDNDQS